MSSDGSAFPRRAVALFYHIFRSSPMTDDALIRALEDQDVLAELRAIAATLARLERILGQMAVALGIETK